MRAALPLLIASGLLLAACGDDGPAPATHGGAPQSTASAEEARAILSGFGEPYLSADLERGRQLFRRCAACHTISEGGRHRVGPNLHGMFGQEVGTAEGFAYSPALQAADFAWSTEALDDWLANPRTYLPGNRMSFAGLRSEEDRDALIAFLAVETAR
jgi:cytochrome c